VYRRYLRDASLLDDEAIAREVEKGLWGLTDPVPRGSGDAESSRDRR
jgi:hypothetical protein